MKVGSLERPAAKTSQEVADSKAEEGKLETVARTRSSSRGLQTSAS